jgi:stearoyl-CoA desaturase (delta-9 desaturase)
MLKGLWHAHMGWLFDPEQTSMEKYAPDLLADDDLVRVHRLFPALVAVSLIFPALLGYAVTGRVGGAVTAFFWASLVRVGVLHHVTWSINSLCHTFGNRPFKTRDKSTNFWPMAVISMGESWHNLHHADPTAARHGVDRGQVDSTARIIWAFERLGWASEVRWPTRDRLAKARA